MCTLVHAFITCSVDYCDAVLYGVPVKVTRRLQASTAAAARLITGVRRNQHITATLLDSYSDGDTLHWLLVPQRILAKVALAAFDCVRGQGPGYFDDFLVHASSHCQNSCMTAICRSW